jgi:hypothetical protein
MGLARQGVERMSDMMGTEELEGIEESV